MLQLKSLEIHGFKSFPDKTMISFSNGVTAIVGPNGSGKSNIADAVRWVMGETSSKNLRGTKMEDVIFDGTRARKSLGFAQVTLFLDNSDSDLPIDFAEVSIARRYYRSGESEYLINSNMARLKDIQELLRDTGLGKDGYSIIGQGTITEIITAKSSDRRYLFEEAAGIAKYKYKKEESKKKLSMTQDNILRINDILSELSERLPALEKQSEKAKKFLKLRDEKKDLEIGLWLNSAELSEEALNKAGAIIEALNENARTAEKELAEKEDLIDKKSDENQKLTEEIENLRSDAKALENGKSEKTGKILVIENDIEHAQNDKNRLEEEKTAFLQEKNDILKERTEALQKLGLLDEEIKTLEAESKTLFEEKEKYAEGAGDFYRQTEELEQNIREKASEINRLQTTAAVISQSEESAEKRFGLISEEKLSSEERLSTLRKNLEEAELKISDINTRIEENANIIRGHEIKFRLSKDKEDTLDTECQKLSQKINEKSGRQKMLSDMEKNHEGFSGSVHLVIGDAEKGILQGIHGTVASIINVSQEFTVAVETALGAAIQNIITENEAAAKNAIFYLKNKRAGRATFLPLSSIKGKTLFQNTLKMTDGFLGIASELIGFDGKYKEIVNFLLGRTVIVDTLDNGTELAKKNNYSFKIVTTDGQVINPGGSLTGGSVAKSVGVLSRRNEITALTEETAAMREELAAKRKTLDGLLTETNRLSILLKDASDEKVSLEKAQFEENIQKSNTEDYIQNVLLQLGSLENELKRTAEMLESMKKEKAETSKAVDILTSESGKLTEDLGRIKSQHTELNQQQESINTKIHEKSLEMLAKTKESETFRDTIRRTEESEAKTSEKIMLRETEINEQAEKTEALKNEIDKLNEEISAVESLLKDSGEKVKSLIDKRLETEKEISLLRESEKAVYELKEKLAREIEKTEAGRNSARENLESLQSRLWDEYEITFNEAKNTYKKPTNIAEATKKVSELKNQIKNLGAVNVEAIDEYVSVKERYEELSKQVGDLVRAKEELERIIVSIEKEMTDIFNEKFRQISIEFEKVFKELFDGGEAKLSITDEENVLESGIDIFVAPPGKIIKNMSSLSGGEQSLTAIALYFAILNIHPAPFCLLDEIEAALDDVNVSRYAEYLHKLSSKTQLITITHRRGTMEIADRLYGVTMREKGISRIITINVNEIEQNL